jgi:sigma-E factor negative regulatory protein RseA
MMATGGDNLITRTVMETQMDTQKKIREHISALSDGELAATDLELAFAALRAADGEQAWSTYHRIGDVLRAQASPELSDDFNDRLSAKLALEPAHAVRRAPAPAQSEPERASAKKVATTS